MAKFPPRPIHGLSDALRPYVYGQDLPRNVAEELASVFDVSARTIYRRLDAYRAQPGTLLAAAPQRQDEEAAANPGHFAWPLIDEGVALATGPTPPTVLEQVLLFGPGVFRFDRELIGLAYVLQGNMHRLWRELVAAGYPMPSYVTFWRRWREVPALVRDAATHGMKNRARFGLYIRHSAQRANEVWQLDAFHLDIEVRVLVGSRYQRIRPTLLLLIDDYSRCCVGWCLTYRRTRAEDVKALFGATFEGANDPATGRLIGGVPECLIVDNEAAIVAAEVREGLLGIPMAVRPAPAHQPTSKGKVERAGKTIQSLIVTGQAGVQTQMAARNGDHLLHMPDTELWDEGPFLQRTGEIMHGYNDSPMSELGGRTRRAAYLESLGEAGPRLVAPELLAKLMLPVGMGGKRLLSPSGIEVDGQFFIAPELGPFLGSKNKLIVTRWHHRLDHVGVFDRDRRFICMAKRVDLLSDAERGQVVTPRFEDERKVGEAAAYARTMLAAASRDRELASCDLPQPLPTALFASPVPPAAGKGSPKSRKARPSSRKGNASRPNAERPSITDAPRSIYCDAAEAIAMEQMSKRFGEGTGGS